MRECRTYPRDCPFEFDEHWPMCGHIPDHSHVPIGEHQHRPKRSRAGKNSRIVALLCHNMHMAVDNGGTLHGRAFYDEWDPETSTYRLFEKGRELPWITREVPA